MNEETNSGETIHFDRLRVKNAYDLGSISLNDLEDRINIVHGPNEAGKTTLLQTFRALLWPDDTSIPGSSDALMISGNDEWFVERQNGSVSYQKNGQDQDGGPPVPPTDRRDRYHLALHDLLQDDTDGSDFAEQVFQEVAGGYDIREALSNLNTEDSPSTARIKERKQFNNADEKLSEAEQTMEELEEHLRERSDLKEQITEAKDAKRLADLYEKLLQYRNVENDYQKASNELNKFPEVMEEVHGDEIDRVEQLDDKITELEREAGEAEQDRDRAQQKLEKFAVPGDDLKGRRRKLESLVDQLSEQEKALDEIESDLKEARESQHSAEADLNLEPGKHTEALDEFDRDEHGRLTDLAREREKMHAKIESLEHRLDLLEHEVPDGDLPEQDRVHRAIDHLLTWLSHPAHTEETEDDTTQWNLELALLAVAGASIAVLGAFVDLLFLIGLVIPAVLGWLLYQNRVKEEETPDETRREASRAEFVEADLPHAPEAWTEKSVRKALRDAVDTRQSLKYRNVIQEEQKKTRAELNNARDQKAEEVDPELDEFFEEYGRLLSDEPEPGEASAGSLVYVTGRLMDWAAARDEVRSLKERRESVREQREDTLDRINEEIEVWSLDPIENAAEADGRLKKIEERIEEHDELIRQREQAKKDLDRIRNRQLPERREERRKIFESLDLDPDDTSGLRDLCEKTDDYQDVQERVRAKEVERNNLRNTLEDREEFTVKLLDLSEPEIEERLEEHSRVAEGLEDLRENHTRLDEQIKNAKGGYSVEPAMAEREYALDELEGQFWADLRGMINRELGDYLEDQTFAEAESNTMERAGALLSKITSGTYELQVESGDPPRFYVSNTKTGRGKYLNDLSDGTRIQLLLSVRLAFVEEQETGLRLPLFLDETLANADDVRANTIIDALFTLTDGGRQLFYVTAQADEVAKWQAVAERKGKDINVIDLPEHVDNVSQATVDLPDDSALEEEVDVPAVGDRSHEEYADEIGVPPVDIWTEVGAVHLWYLIEDLEYLEELLRDGIETWGQYRRLYEIPDVDVLGDRERDQYLAIRERARAIETFIELNKIGRNRPIDRDTLEDSGAVSGRLIDKVTDLAEECEWDPEEVIRGLREKAVKNFQTPKRKELKEYFQQENFIDPREPLSPEDIRTAMRTNVNEDNLPTDKETEIKRLWKRLSKH